MRDLAAQIEAATAAAVDRLAAVRAAAGTMDGSTTGNGSGQVEFRLVAELEARRMLAIQRQIDEFRRNVVKGRWAGPNGPSFIPATSGEDGNRGVLEDYLANGYVGHGAYLPFTRLVPQYPRRPGETWMDRKPMALAWATTRPDRVVYFGLCERPWAEGASCYHYSPDESEIIVTFALPAGTQRLRAAPENRGYALLFPQEQFRKAKAQQMYVTDRVLAPEAIIELTPEAWTGPPLALLPNKAVPKRDHELFGYEYEGVPLAADDENSLYVSASSRAPRLAPCASGMSMRIRRDPDWLPDVEWRPDAVSHLKSPPKHKRRLWRPGGPPPPWPANQVDRASTRLTV